MARSPEERRLVVAFRLRARPGVRAEPVDRVDPVAPVEHRATVAEVPHDARTGLDREADPVAPDDLAFDADRHRVAQLDRDATGVDVDGQHRTHDRASE